MHKEREGYIMYLGLKFYGWGKCMKRLLGERYRGRKKKLGKIALEIHTEIFTDKMM